MVIRFLKQLFHKDMIVYWCISLILCWGIAYLFFRSVVVMGGFSFGAVFLVYVQNNRRKEKEQWQLTLQFRDGIQSLSNALVAGYSIENAFAEALKDLCFLYSDDAMIVREFQNINYQIRLSRNVEELLMEFGIRSGIEDIISFSEVVMTAKRTGGDLIKVIRTTSSNISDKIDIQTEIGTLIAAKKMEGYIMCVIPIGIIVYLNMCMPEFLLPMYETLVGRVVMTVALIFYILAIVLLQKIVNIKV